MRVFVCACMHACACVCVRVCVCACVCVFVLPCVCVYMRMCKYLCCCAIDVISVRSCTMYEYITLVLTYIYIYIYMDVCIHRSQIAVIGTTYVVLRTHQMAPILQDRSHYCCWCSNRKHLHRGEPGDMEAVEYSNGEQ